ncbi:Alpha/Beta hydrolase protein [Xylariales sp. PMI_506]|nr:Alpha/Beta hydrolase protein [Xylariales sp. PMI_506]
MAQTSSVKTRDGTRLSYSQTGLASGPEILFIAGWRQTAAQWRKQVEHFQAEYHITTYDHRGHGESDKPAVAGSGAALDPQYTVRGLAEDLHDLLAALDLKDLTVVAHSMGCSVIWALVAHYPEDWQRVRRFVLVDQSPHMLKDGLSGEPGSGAEYGAETEAQALGAVFDAAMVDTLPDIFGPMYPALARSFYTPGVSDEDYGWADAQAAKMDQGAAVNLLMDHARQDWRAVLPLIDVPTLVICAEASAFPPQHGRYLHSKIPGARGADLVLFGKDEGGSHFMFWENSEKFNSEVGKFVRG